MRDHRVAAATARESGNPKCANCMVHSGYEASAVNDTFHSLKGFLATIRATFSSLYQDSQALRDLETPPRPALVQIAAADQPRNEVNV